MAAPTAVAVEAAVRALYGATTPPQQRAAANTYLMQCQTAAKSAAWTFALARELLCRADAQGASQQSRFVGATLLLARIHDAASAEGGGGGDGLPAAERARLRDVLLARAREAR